MGTAILSGILNQQAQAEEPRAREWAVNHIFISVQSPASVSRLQEVFHEHLSRITIYQQDNLSLTRNSHVVLLACKPALMESILGAEGIGRALDKKVVISVLAGKSTESTEKAIIGSQVAPESDEPHVHVVRTMPNMAARVGESMTVVAAPRTESEKKAVDVTRWLFDHVGKTHTIPESKFDLIGSLVGCSGAMLTLAIEGLLGQSVAGGLGRSEALILVTQSLFGLAKLLEAGNHPSILREEIASPGGSTIQGLMELEKRGVRSAFASALEVTGEQAKQLGRNEGR